MRLFGNHRTESTDFENWQRRLGKPKCTGMLTASRLPSLAELRESRASLVGTTERSGRRARQKDKVAGVRRTACQEYGDQPQARQAGPRPLEPRRPRMNTRFRGAIGCSKAVGTVRIRSSMRFQGSVPRVAQTPRAFGKNQRWRSWLPPRPGDPSWRVRKGTLF